MTTTDTHLAPDAAIVLGLASTAMPFARTPEAEAERWLRILRLHGEAGATLQALGVSEGRLDEPHRDADLEHPAASADRADPVAQVVEEAIDIAERRGRGGVATADLLLAVMSVYGADFDRVLRAHGTDREELAERLGVRLPSREGFSPFE
jgi:hypothetical protein